MVYNARILCARSIVNLVNIKLVTMLLRIVIRPLLHVFSCVIPVVASTQLVQL